MQRRRRTRLAPRAFATKLERLRGRHRPGRGHQAADSEARAAPDARRARPAEWCCCGQRSARRGAAPLLAHNDLYLVREPVP